MGYEQLLSAIDRYGTTDFNELARQEAIPSETAAYVPKIAAAAIVANNLERFGFDKVEIARPVDGGGDRRAPGHAAQDDLQGGRRGHRRSCARSTRISSASACRRGAATTS
jgi:molybdopterin biosynthesis enzyme